MSDTTIIDPTSDTTFGFINQSRQPYIAVFVLLLLWVTFRTAKYIGYRKPYYLEKRQVVTTTTGVTAGTNVTTLEEGTAHKARARADLGYRFSRAADVARTAFILLLSCALVMSAAGVDSKAILVLAWVYMGISAAWVVTSLITDHPIIHVVMAILSYPLVIAMWSICFNKTS